MSDRDDTFDLYDLRVEVAATDRPMVCRFQEMLAALRNEGAEEMML